MSTDADEVTALKAEIERLNEELRKLKESYAWVDEFVDAVANPQWIL